jgi:hypothetical protein
MVTALRSVAIPVWGEPSLETWWRVYHGKAHAMASLESIRAWTDEAYQLRLCDAERAQAPTCSPGRAQATTEKKGGDASRVQHTKAM